MTQRKAIKVVETIIQESEREKALDKIGGYISADGNNVIYYDDNMRKWYVTPASDLDCMVALMNDPDPEIRVSAYSHWCASTSAEEFDTEEEAIAATEEEYKRSQANEQ